MKRNPEELLHGARVGLLGLPRSGKPSILQGEVPAPTGLRAVFFLVLVCITWKTWCPKTNSRVPFNGGIAKVLELFLRDVSILAQLLPLSQSGF